MTLVTFQLPGLTMSDRQSQDQAAAYELEQLQSSRSAEANSRRSRASSVVSSVISTGTKFSTSTIPQGSYHIDGVLEASGSGSAANDSNAKMMTTRPGSLYSVRSTTTSLPPYESHQNDSSLTLTSQDGHSPPAGGLPNEQPSTPSTSIIDPENLISRHYGNVVRTIDANHQRLLARTIQGHEQELAATRDAIDKVYRKEFKAKDREVEKVREEAAAEIAELEEAKERELDKGREENANKVEALEAKVRKLRVDHEEVVASLRRIAASNAEEMSVMHEKGIEKACNAIEDIWEKRWNDRMKLTAEEGQRRVEKRDEEWLGVLEREHPELVEEIKRAMGFSG